MDATPPPSPAPPELLERFDPDPDALLVWLRERVDNRMLRAVRDMDPLPPEGSLEALIAIRDGTAHEIPVSAAEALNLTQWTDASLVEDQSPDGIRRALLERAFAAAALIRWEENSGNRAWADRLALESATALQLVEAMVLLNEASGMRAAAQLLAWRLHEDTVGFDDRPWFILGLIVLASEAAPADALETTARWLDTEAHRTRDAATETMRSLRKRRAQRRLTRGRWLFGLVDWHGRKDEPERWRELVRRRLINRPDRLPAGARESLGALGRRVVADER